MATKLYNTAKHLVGQKLGRWNVIEILDNKTSTGGNFSSGYTVEDEEGNKGFLKALDYSRALSPSGNPDMYKAQLDAFIFERDLMNECKDNRLKHVVKIVDSGRFTIPDSLVPEDMYCPPVDYLVMEKADKSVREMIDLSLTFDIAWMLRSLHNVAVGIEELHGIQIAHQDIKPSNILVFQGQNTTKIGDIGRSISFKHPSEQDRYLHAGDPKYAPLELLYGVSFPDQKMHRYSCDMYMFGNLIFTYFNNVSLTISILQELPLDAQPGYWRDSYHNILPQIELVFAKCMEDFNKGLPIEVRDNLIELVKQLCEPDHEKRGDIARKHLGAVQYSLQKYITRLDLMARQQEIKMKRALL